MSNNNHGTTRTVESSALVQFHDYRCYLTPEFWLITYQDRDFIRVMRNVGHKPGFVIILLELIWDLCRGTRTALRERWAIHQQLAERDAEKIILQAAAAPNKVIEFWFERRGRETSRADAHQEPET